MENVLQSCPKVWYQGARSTMNNVQIDVRDLPCPEPVVKVKKALVGVTATTLKHANYEILGNTLSAKENLSRFLRSAGYEFEIGHSQGEQYMIIIKDKIESSKKEYSDKLTQKVLFIKDDKVGEGELGVMLINALIKSLLHAALLPQKIIFVNRGVLLTTDNSEVENDDIVEVLKELEKFGVEIYSCGSCLSYYAMTERLKVGMIGNAVESLEAMLQSNGVLCL